MPKIDLVTGFLGSGKTTFLHYYGKALMEAGRQIGILENDFGAVNVDMMLLSDLEGEQCELEMVAGGCDADCHRRRFKTKLIAMGMCGYDRVLVEPSGIYDTEEFFDVLCEEPLDRWYEIGSVIALVDAALEEDMPEEAERILAAQLSAAGSIVLSRTQEAGKEQIIRTVDHINRILERRHCARRFSLTGEDGTDRVWAKPWNELTKEDYLEMQHAGCRADGRLFAAGADEEAFQTLYYMNLELTEKELEAVISRLYSDTSAGRVLRVKGFLKSSSGYVQINATKELMRTDQAEAGQEVVIVIGQDLQTEKIDALMGKKAGTL